MTYYFRDDDFEDWLTAQSGPWMPLEDSTDPSSAGSAAANEVVEKSQPETDT
jgi:hypothetical protein